MQSVYENLVAEITDITNTKHHYIISMLTGKVSRILNDILDGDVIVDIADTIYPYIVVKQTPADEQYGDYSITFKNVRAELLRALNDVGLQKNPEPPGDVEHSESFELLLNDLCSIQFPLWDSC